MIMRYILWILSKTFSEYDLPWKPLSYRYFCDQETGMNIPRRRPRKRLNSWNRKSLAFCLQSMATIVEHFPQDSAEPVSVSLRCALRHLPFAKTGLTFLYKMWFMSEEFLISISLNSVPFSRVFIICIWSTL